MKKYNVLAIGTGIAGSMIAQGLRKAGLSVGIVDQRPYGGTCALFGCNPKKVLAGASEAYERATSYYDKGIDGDISLNWHELHKYMLRFTESIPSEREIKYKDLGIDMYHGHAKLVGKNEIEINGTILHADKIIVAPGSKPRPLSFPGADYLITSDEFFGLEELPEHIIFVGGGYISFESAHIMARAGAQVTILESSGKPLRNFDEDMVNLMLKRSKEIGIKLICNTAIQSVKKEEDSYIVSTDHGKFKADVIVHGAGRVPNIKDLQLEKGNVEFDGYEIKINQYLQSISNPSVYIAGDVNIKGMALTPVGDMEHEVVVKNILKGNVAIPNYQGVPSVVFTLPLLASCGLSELDAKERGLDVVINYADTSNSYTTKRLALHYSGYKVILDKKNGKILGAHLCGHHVDEVINIFALAIRNELSVDDIRKMVWAFPTLSSTIEDMIK